MIEYRNGNIWDAVKEVDAVTNCVNTVGVMGKGVAIQFKSRFPAMFADYIRVCDSNTLSPGEIHVWENPKPLPKFIFNFATKGDWHDPSKYEWIEAGLLEMATRIRSYDVKSVAMPALGCGAGGLSWPKIKEMIQKNHDLFWAARKIIVYEPLR